MDLLELDNLQVLAVHKKGNFLSGAIRFFLNRYFNHTGTIIKINNVLWVFEAIEQGAKLTPLNDYINGISNDEYEVAIFTPKIELNIENDTISKWLDFVKKYVDKTPYDFANLLLCQPVLIVTGQWIGKTGTETMKRQICNELTYNHIAYSFNNIKPIGYKANLNDIMNYYEQNGNLITKNNVNEFLS